MKARVNTYALEQVKIESASLPVLGTIAHLMQTEGVFSGTVYRGRTQVGRFRIDVGGEHTNLQADIDLSRLGGKEMVYGIRNDGYAVFYVSEGAGGFWLQLQKYGDEALRTVFDSRSLGAGDVFAATLLRPGRYEMTAHGAERATGIVVSYPAVGKTPYRPKPPVSVRLTPDGLDTPSLELGPGQAVVVKVECNKATISVECKKPDEGPQEVDRPRTRRHNPRPPKDTGAK